MGQEGEGGKGRKKEVRKKKNVTTDLTDDIPLLGCLLCHGQWR